ncbi:hypothetical protein HMPREF1222_01621 [Treponema vincentii F0403]|uniref:Carrier domain-containing protein n=1 Tax=Treponema vincentii F0403 TaxID=1125702 RepID=S3MAV3_9SPIR|nr:phosphopantetheine-binding protein [Treponema vincentii]EPF46109.1 hypothetical protein HMPREF1222_01621 [Treponema vincentii F0403]
MNTKEDIQNEIKNIIIQSLDLEDIKPEDIDAEAPLFVEGEGLSLDSIDALELGVALKKKFGISFSQNEEDNKKYFYSVATLSDFVAKNAE